MKHIFIGFSLVLFAAGCSQGDERLLEKARLEGGASSQAQIQSENENLAKKAKEMEEDLAVRHRFYQAVRGTYEGTLQTEQSAFNIRVTLYPSLAPYRTDRTRALEEIVADLNGLHFNVQVVQWNPTNSLSAVGCRITSVKPDLSAGEINIASENCPNFYALRVSEDVSMGASAEWGRSAVLAQQIRDGHLTRIARIQGQVQPSTNSAVYQFSLTRKE